MTKKILFAASNSISSAVIDLHLAELPESLSGEDVVFLDGSTALKKSISSKWPQAASISAKSRSSYRSAFEKVAHIVLFWDGDDLTRFLFEARLGGVPTKLIPVEVTRVVNKKMTSDYDVYIGRGSRWGNPFVIGHGEGPDRADVIREYEKFFKEKLESDPDFKKGVLGLRGLRLACFCKPEACHGDVIANYLNGLPVSGDQS